LAAIVSHIVDVCIFRRTQKGTEYLILQRSADEELYPNLWQLLTGTIARQEKALETAKRELQEETSLPIKRMWTVPYVDSFFSTAQDAVHLSPVFAVETADGVPVKLSDEHQQYLWMNYEAAYQQLIWPGQRQALHIVNEYIVGVSEAGRLMELILTSEGTLQ
jgi:8-oxo-dGTP pyrophosphatase MutT (NUDIX family)